MCERCGCSGNDHTQLHSPSERHVLEHVHADGTAHSHAGGQHPHIHEDHQGAYAAHGGDDECHPRHHVHAPEVIDLKMRVLTKNDEVAEINRTWFAQQKVLALNLVSSPGAGKTTLLERTIRDLRGTIPIYVIEGDQATANDAVRIRSAGAPAVQVNTGTGCHLEAAMVARGVAELQPPGGSLLLIENVGNLVCPAMFDLGERAKVVILSTTEGDDKPLKYPHMFRAAEIMVLNKIDLLPHVDFDVQHAVRHARAINPGITVIALSARTGEGLDAWYEWLHREIEADRGPT